jgi:hypothetical protein
MSFKKSIGAFEGKIDDIKSQIQNLEIVNKCLK